MEDGQLIDGKVLSSRSRVRAQKRIVCARWRRIACVEVSGRGCGQEYRANNVDFEDVCVRVRVCMWVRVRVQQINQPVDAHEALLGVWDLACQRQGQAPCRRCMHPRHLQVSLFCAVTRF